MCGRGGGVCAVCMRWCSSEHQQVGVGVGGGAREVGRSAGLGVVTSLWFPHCVAVCRSVLLQWVVVAVRECECRGAELGRRRREEGGNGAGGQCLIRR